MIKFKHGDRRQRCATCSGTGKVHYPSLVFITSEGAMIDEVEDPCPVCDGKGWVEEEEARGEIHGKDQIK